MAFGLAVSDYNIETGSYGKTIKLDLSAYLVHSVNFIQGESSTGVKSDIVSSGVELDTLQSYIESETCPDLAWSFNGMYLTIFFKNGVYDTRFMFDIYRRPQNMTSDASYMDAPPRDLDLIKAYALESFYLNKNMRTPYPIQKLIEQEEERIINET